MAHLSFFLQPLYIIKNAGAYQPVKILVLIHTVQEPEIRIICSQRLQFPGEGFSDHVQIPGPAVFSLFVIDRSEMQLEKHLFPLSGKGPAKRFINIFSSCTQVKKVDAVLGGGAHHALNLRIRAVLNASHPQTEHAEFFLCRSMGQLSVLHKNPPFRNVSQHPAAFSGASCCFYYIRPVCRMESRSLSCGMN